MPKVVPGYKDAARSRIVEAAFRVFSSKGYGDATMDDVARELGVSKGAIYLYFKSKEDVLKEISLESQESMMQVLLDCFQLDNLEKAAEEIYDRIFEKKQAHFKMLFEITGLAMHDEKIRRSQREKQDRALETILQVLKHQVKKGVLKKGSDTRETAVMLAALYMGLARLLVLGYDRTEIHRIWRESFLMILRDNSGRPPSQ